MSPHDCRFRNSVRYCTIASILAASLSSALSLLVLGTSKTQFAMVRRKAAIVEGWNQLRMQGKVVDGVCMYITVFRQD
jgi:hypothetical protein